jgi:nucleotide-binding universal stress UspA family protein
VFSRIVVGTDGSDTAKTAVDRALDLARTCGATVDLVTAWKVSTAFAGGDAFFPGKDHEAEGRAEAAVDKAAQDLLDEHAAGAKGVKVETHVAHGAPADVILNIAEQVNADLIVIGSRGMHGAHRVLGSVPNSVSHHARCDVLIVNTA